MRSTERFTAPDAALTNICSDNAVMFRNQVPIFVLLDCSNMASNPSSEFTTIYPAECDRSTVAEWDVPTE